MKTSASTSTRVEPSADLLFGLVAPFERNAERLKVLLKVLHLVPRLSPGVAFTPDHLPKHHPPRQAFFSHAHHEAREQHFWSAYRHLNYREICPDNDVGIGQDVVFVLQVLPAEASEEHLVVELS